MLGAPENHLLFAVGLHDHPLPAVQFAVDNQSPEKFLDAFEQGADADPYASITKNGETAFSTLYVPPFPAPGFGQIRFRGKGKTMGIGYQFMFNRDGTDGLVFAGALRCQYKKKGK